MFAWEEIRTNEGTSVKASDGDHRNRTRDAYIHKPGYAYAASLFAQPARCSEEVEEEKKRQVYTLQYPWWSPDQWQIRLFFYGSQKDSAPPHDEDMMATSSPAFCAVKAVRKRGDSYPVRLDPASCREVAGRTGSTWTRRHVQASRQVGLLECLTAGNSSINWAGPFYSHAWIVINVCPRPARRTREN
jgi:hypothetical protein